MEKIELLEKIVEVQEMNIELMQDCNSLKFSYELKTETIKKLTNEIKQKDERIAELEKQIADLEKKYEELQQSLVSVETPEKI